MRNTNLAAKKLLRRATVRKPVRPAARMTAKPTPLLGKSDRPPAYRQTKRASEAASGVQRGWRKIYVGGLPPHTLKDDLQDAFFEFGPIADIFLARNPPGFGFVEFEESRDAARALRVMDGNYILGEKIKVQFARALGPQRMAVINSKKRFRHNRPFPRGALGSPVRKKSISPLMSRAISPVGLRGRSPAFLRNAPRRSPLRFDRHRSPPPRSHTSGLPPLSALYDPHDPHFRQMTMLGAWERGRSPPLLPPLPPLPPYRSRSPSPRSRHLSPKGRRSRSPGRKRDQRSRDRSAAASLVYPPLSLPPPSFIESDSPPLVPQMSPPYLGRRGSPRGRSPRRGPPSPLSPRRPRSPPYGPNHARPKSPPRSFQRSPSPRPRYDRTAHVDGSRRLGSPGRNFSPPGLPPKRWSPAPRSPGRKASPKYRTPVKTRSPDRAIQKARYNSGQRSPVSGHNRNMSPARARPRSPAYGRSPARRPRSPLPTRVPSLPPKTFSPPPLRNRSPPSPIRNRSPPPRNRSPPPRNRSPPPRNRSPPPRDRSPPPRNRSPPPRNRSPPPRDRSPPPRNRSPPPRNRSPPPRNRSPPPRDRSPPPRDRSPPPRKAPPSEPWPQSRTRYSRTPPRGYSLPRKNQSPPPRPPSPRGRPGAYSGDYQAISRKRSPPPLRPKSPPLRPRSPTSRNGSSRSYNQFSPSRRSPVRSGGTDDRNSRYRDSRAPPRRR